MINGKRKRGDADSSIRSHARQDSASTEVVKGAPPGNSVFGADQSQRPVRNNHVQSKLQARAKELLAARQSLPVWSQASSIRHSLATNDVLLLIGETGSGKSTQIPQMLLEEPWFVNVQTSHKSDSQNIANRRCGGCIAVTQPRRVAAISLARRVAEEMGTPLGASSPASRVGYSVRFDNSTSPRTQIKYLTEGMLLQEMLRDPTLRQYSAVVVDEVHERGLDVDMVMGFLKRLLEDKDAMAKRNGVPLKVIVMSATAEIDPLMQFFTQPVAGKSNTHIQPAATQNPILNGIESQRREDGKTECLESDSEWSGISSSSISDEHSGDGVKTTLSAKSQQETHDTVHTGPAMDQLLSNGAFPSGWALKVAECAIEGRQFPVSVQYTVQPVQDFLDAALRAIFQIHHKESLPGDILVFLTGQEAVESLECLVNDYTSALAPEVPGLLVLPLFAALSQVAQHRIFQPAPAGVRKVILATNLAETSVTVSGVRFVIDCGKSKQKQFRSSIGLESLLVKPISKSSAIQRKGRAGREGPGHCYRLYTESTYLALQEAPVPEILRCDLTSAILTLKARGVDDVHNFPFLSPPSSSAVEKALLMLLRLGALESDGSISHIGRQMSQLPLPPQLSRSLVAANTAQISCIEEVIDIVACLCAENIFISITSDEKKELAETARRELFRREGDHLTLLATVHGYLAEQSNRKQWCQEHFVSHRAMKNVMNIRKQLRAKYKLRSESDMVEKSHKQADDAEGNPNPNPVEAVAIAARPNTSLSPTIPIIDTDKAQEILKCFLHGFSMNTARLIPDGTYRTLVDNQTVTIHPSSVLFGANKLECICYNEYVFTNKAYARGVSAIQLDWVAKILEV